MEKTSKKENKKQYKGIVVVKELKVGTKNPRVYKKGDTFTTDNQEDLQILINLKKIK